MPTSPPADLPDTTGLDLRLVVCDMDGTLLDGEGRVPDALWPMLDVLHERGVTFTPASGRQYATLRAMFDRAPAETVYIAENGAFVVRDDIEISSVVLPAGSVPEVVGLLREHAAAGVDLGVVLCGRRTAYVERTDRGFLDHVDPYYLSLRQVDDLLEVDDEPVKIAVWTSADPEQSTAPALAGFEGTHQVVVSGAHWVDVMPPDVDKGVAVRELQRALGVTAAQTVVFGDYLNDLEMLDAADWSFAMAEAHPTVLARARYTAPSHRDQGVLTVLEELLGRTPA